MNVPLVVGIISLPVTGGAVATWLWARRRERETIAMRLARLTPDAQMDDRPATLLKVQEKDSDSAENSLRFEIPGLDRLKDLLIESDVDEQLPAVASMIFALLVLPIFVSFTFNFNIAIAVCVGILLSIVPIFVLKTKADGIRAKFSEQLPDAIDLMVAILRSGHSVSQSVKAVAEDVPAPCGQEFEKVLHRMNLGQPLSEALVYSARRFNSYELDLMRKAVSIQSEVGGSLAELLDKTNVTLRQRLKLVRQLKVITAQSRLSAQIVGALPFVLAIALNIMNPGYMQSLLDEPMGQALVCGVIVLQALGILVMRRMSTMKV